MISSPVEEAEFILRRLRGCILIAVVVVVGLAGCGVAAEARAPRPAGYRRVARVPVGEHPVAMVALDLDADGDLDLVVPSSVRSELTLLVNDGAGGLTGQGLSLPEGTPSLVAADFDEDGHQDLALAQPGRGEVLLLRGGAAGFAPWMVAAVRTPFALAAGDRDGDGHVDLAVASFAGETTTLLRGDGRGGLAAMEELAGPTGASSVLLEDVDRDGRGDVAVTGTRAGELWLTSTSTSTRTGPTGGWPLGVIAAQLDGDRALELIGAANQGDALFIGELSAPGAALVMRTLPLAGQPGAVAAADLDADGDLDLVVTAKAADRVDLLLSDGAGNLGYWRSLATGVAPTPLVIADLDGDHCPDIAFANAFSNDVMLYRCVPE